MKPPNPLKIAFEGKVRGGFGVCGCGGRSKPPVVTVLSGTEGGAAIEEVAETSKQHMPIVIADLPTQHLLIIVKTIAKIGINV